MLFHVGYPKASSTWLQERLFLPQHGFFPVYFNKTDREILNNFLVDPTAFNYDAARFRADLEERLRHGLERQHTVPVISAESLTGMSNDAPMGSTKLIAERIHNTWPDAKILIVVREQFSIILSGYFQYVRGGGIRSLESYVHPPSARYSFDAAWTGV